MLTPDQIELIHREIDGANTRAGRAACRSLLEGNPEARALAADLRRVTVLLERDGLREPPPRLQQAILDALGQQARGSPPAIVRWTVSQLRLVTERMETIMTRKALLIGSAAVAVLIVGAALITGFPPTGGGAGTIGGDSIPGVQQAARYQGRLMTEADVSLKNPEIQALLQNDQILHLVQSDAFRQVMRDADFRALQSDAAYNELMSSELYHELMADEAFRQLQAQGAFRAAQSAEAMRALQNNELFRKLQENELFLRLQENELFRQLQESELFRRLQENELFRQLQSEEAFRKLQESELFRSLSRSQQLSELFMSEAMRVNQ